MESYILSFGLVAVFLGVILEGEFLFLTGVMFANTGHLDLSYVLIAGYMGALTHDWIFYALGKTQGQAFFEKRPKLEKRLDKLLVPFHKNDWLFFLSYRFLIGFRMILIVLFGISNVSIKKFLLVSSLGNGELINCVSMRSYFFLLQGKKRRRCRASTRLFNEAEGKKNK